MVLEGTEGADDFRRGVQGDAGDRRRIPCLGRASLAARHIGNGSHNVVQGFGEKAVDVAGALVATGKVGAEPCAERNRCNGEHGVHGIATREKSDHNGSVARQ